MKKLFFIFVLSFCSFAAWAYDFNAVAPTGQILYYIITSDSTVEVSGGTNLTGSLTIPNTVVNGVTYSVTCIGRFAFIECNGLTAVTIPSSVTSIERFAFCNCNNLTTITIPSSVTSIGDYAFYGCSSLTAVTIPNTVTSIGRAAFYGCIGLTSLTIPNSVTSIGKAAFEYCRSLTSMTIPNSVTSIGDMVFSSCNGLTSLVVEDGNTVYDSRENCNAIIETASNTMIAATNNTFIPHSVTGIGYAAFAYCDNLTDVTIPISVTSIGEGAFAGCNSLTSLVVEDGNTVYDSRENCNAIIETASNTMIAGTGSTVIPNSVTGIGNYVFGDCLSLTSMTIPNSVESIGEWAFGDCLNLTTITIGSGVTTVQEEAFYGCENLDTIICNAVTPPTVADTNAFTGVWKGLPLIVPGESVGQYQSAYGWRDFYNIIGKPVGIKEVDNGHKVFAVSGGIAVCGAEGQTLSIYDVLGRLIVSEKAADNKLYTVPTTGMYIVQVGKQRAQKVMVFR